VAAAAAPEGVLFRLAARKDREDLSWAYANADLLRVELADLRVLAGLLALEQGDTPAAAAQFRKALDLGTVEGGREVDFPGRPLAAACLRRLEAAGAGRQATKGDRP
jgi:hypothetical protein